MISIEEFEKETGIDINHVRQNFNTYGAFHAVEMLFRCIEWQEKRNEWVSAEERLPEDRQTVLVFNPVSGVNQAVYRKGTGTNGFTLLAWGNRSGAWYPFVELWRPLPIPPDEAKRGRG